MGPHPHSLQNPTLTACGTPSHSLRDSTLTHHRTHPCTRGAYLRTPWDPFSADADVTPRNPTPTPRRTPSSQLVSPHPYTLPDLPLAPCGNPATLAPLPPTAIVALWDPSLTHCRCRPVPPLPCNRGCLLSSSVGCHIMATAVCAHHMRLACPAPTSCRRWQVLASWLLTSSRRLRLSCTGALNVVTSQGISSVLYIKKLN